MARLPARRLARRATNVAPASRSRGRPRGGAAPERHADPKPRTEHPLEGDNAPHVGGGHDGSGAPSLRPSQSPATSSLGCPTPSPEAALRMAQELLH